MQNWIQNLRVEYLPENGKFWKKIFFGSVFDTEKYGYKIFPKFEIFGFFRNLVRDQLFCTIRGMKECEILANGPVRD